VKPLAENAVKSSIVIMVFFLLAGCAPGAIRAGRPNTHQSEKITTSAIYLVHDQGQLSTSDLRYHPEVMVATSFDAFKRDSQAKVALWIDKNAVSMVTMDWLHQAPQKYYPLVLVGSNDALYAFREMLQGFPISGPAIDWSTTTLEPGFSVWMVREETSSSISTYMKGYAQTPTVEAILTITNALLKVGPPE
jgi:hypothetical protein